jgi:transposase
LQYPLKHWRVEGELCTSHCSPGSWISAGALHALPLCGSTGLGDGSTPDLCSARAADHDFTACAKVTPVGILHPQSAEVFLACVTSKVTSDCLVDVLELWWQCARGRYCQVHTLVINLDNGPANQSHRTQFLKRLVDFAQASQLTIQLAYYPPYHSKYNPVERCWGILENHWNGDVLDTIETVVKFAQTMTWKGSTPVVHLLTTLYPTGVRLTKQAMTEIEKFLERFNGLERWFLKIFCAPL